MNPDRRRFLAMAGCGIGASALTTFIDQMTLATAYAAPGNNYKALVCVFLAGGNDGNNTIIPLGDSTDPTGGYPAYAQVRHPAQLDTNLAANQLLPIAPPSMPGPFGLHPKLVNLQGLFNAGNVAIVPSVGPLVQYLDRPTYQQASSLKPFQLFSHADQVNQWQTAVSVSRSATGWGGRTADNVSDPGALMPMVTSISGTPIFAIGATKRPLGIGPAPTMLNKVLLLTGYGTSAQEVARRTAFDQLRSQNRTQTLIDATSAVTDQSLAVASLFNVTDPTFTTVFPNNPLGNQLWQVAKIMKLNQGNNFSLGRQQIYFVQLGGFDTHQNQISRQLTLLDQLDKALGAFWSALGEMALQSNVTTFTLSDFSRTFQPSGSGMNIVGTDHAWANHHFILGGSVLGGDFYGLPLPSSSGGNGTVYPTLQLAGPYDTDTRGRWIPTVAVEQYAATLATWYGLPAANLGAVFPTLVGSPPVFAPANLGFMTS